MRVRAGGLSGRGRVRHGFLTGGMGMLLAGVVGAGLTGGQGFATGVPLAPPAVYPADTWQGRTVAVIRVLDKLDAHVEVLSVPVGGTAHYKNLEIGVARCVARPPTLAPDAAAWLDLRDTHPDGVAFHGWMLAAEPALGVLESPLYDVRMIRCEGQNTAPTPMPLATPVVPVLPSATPQPAPGGAPAADGTHLLVPPPGMQPTPGTAQPAPSTAPASTQAPSVVSPQAPLPPPVPFPSGDQNRAGSAEPKTGDTY